MSVVSNIRTGNPYLGFGNHNPHRDHSRNRLHRHRTRWNQGSHTIPPCPQRLARRKGCETRRRGEKDCPWLELLKRKRVCDALIIHNYRPLSTPGAVYFSILSKFFVCCRKSLSAKELRRRDRPDRPKSLPLKDLRRFGKTTTDDVTIGKLERLRRTWRRTGPR